MTSLKFKYRLLIAICLFININLYSQKKVCDELIKKSRIEINNQDFVKALEILSKAKITAEKDKNYEGVFCVLNTTAECYYYLLDYGEALRITLEAYDLAIKKLDVASENKSLINIGVLYIKDKNYIKGEEYLTRAYKSLKEQKNYNEMGLAASNLGDAALMSGDYNKAISRFNEAIALSPKESRAVLNAEIGIIESELYMGKSGIARQKAQLLYADKKLNKSHNYDLRLLNIIAESYLRENKYNLALSNTATILKLNPDIDVKNDTYNLLIKIFTKTGDYTKALAYKDSVMANEQKLNDIRNGRLFETNKVKFEIANYKNEIAVKDERIAFERKIFYSLLGVFTIIVVFAGLVFMQKKHIAERNRKIAELELGKKMNDNLILEKQIREKEINAQLEQERLKNDNLLLEKTLLEKEVNAQQQQKSLQNEIEERNRMLSAKALYLSGRNELVEEIINSMAQIPQVSQNAEVSTYMNTLKSYVKTDAEWDNFIVHFEQVNPNFLRALQHKHPDLSLAQIRFLCYIYMNLNLKEISIILNITLESCKKRKQRIAKTMGVDAEELYTYIVSINA
jgi:tetratricopeptide (TPR) repeat protein